MCSDPERKFYPQRQVCYATMERLAADKRYSDLHCPDSGAAFHNGDFTSWSSKRSPSHPYGAGDGVTIWVADVDLEPDATWLGRVDKEDEQPDQGEDDD